MTAFPLLPRQASAPQRKQDMSFWSSSQSIHHADVYHMPASPSEHARVSGSIW